MLLDRLKPRPSSHAAFWAREAAARRHLAARRIQRAFRRALSDPSYAACRRRLLREFRELLTTGCRPPAGAPGRGT